ncbi:kinectin [Trichonephila clavipes]|nr:kinectin [Trichonephila clavipes]
MAFEKMKTRYDARATGHDFHEGDKVWLWNPKCLKGLSPKLQTNWTGQVTKTTPELALLGSKLPHNANVRTLSLFCGIRARSPNTPSTRP